jgi:uncharacterized membrane protein
MLQEWLSLLVRWAHIVAAIGWIGSSFYFMWLDSSLKRAANMPEGVKGENWSVHGGGFYHIRKYTVAPEQMPEDLHWFQWEAYSTWLTGFALLSVTYYWGASSYLIDRSVADLVPSQAVLLSMASLGLSWVFYDKLCQSRLKDDPTKVLGVLFAFILVMAWLYGQVFSARAAFLHVGAMIATIMSGNVFFTIIPNQRVVVADLKAGRVPDAKYGAIAKLRSTHNNYLTLPVIFMMISNHYPMTFGHEWNVVIVAVVLGLGVVIRNWFNRYEAGERGFGVQWQWPVAVGFAVFMIQFGSWQPDPARAVTARVSGDEAFAIVETHCTACHAPAPRHESFDAPPAGMLLHTPELVRAHADKVAVQLRAKAMPLGNESGMTEEERGRLLAWLADGARD